MKNNIKDLTEDELVKMVEAANEINPVTLSQIGEILRCQKDIGELNLEIDADIVKNKSLLPIRNGCVSTKCQLLKILGLEKDLKAEPVIKRKEFKNPNDFKI